MKMLFCLKNIKKILLLLTILTCNEVSSQTFTNNTVTAAGWAGGTLTKTISVSGITNPLSSGTLELTQVNVHLGRQADGTYNYSYYSVRITSPAGTTAIIVNGQGYAGSWTFPNGSVKEFNCKFRDNQYLLFPSGGSGSLSEPWEIGYYRTLNQDALTVFNGENPNGNWTVTIIETSVSTGARFNSANLIFTPSPVISDYTSFNGNNDCSAPYCLRNSEIVIGTNNGYTSQAGDMYNPNTTGCSWNAAQNNSAWFKFVAASSNVKITISGITNNLQILGISSTGNQCTAANNTVVSGGCPEDAINDTYLSQRYSNGSTNNNQLNMSGLTIGSTYYFIVDGTGGAISPFYLEIWGAEDGACNDILPVKFSSLDAKCNDQNILVTWQTYSEINNDYFTVLKSYNGYNFFETEIIEGAGNSSQIINYSLTDTKTDSSIVDYKIKQTDYDGNESMSQTVTVKCKKTSDIFILNNPDNSEIEISFPYSDNESYNIMLSDNMGRIVYSDNIKFINDSGKTSIDKSDFKTGIYHLSVYSISGIISRQIVIYRN